MLQNVVTAVPLSYIALFRFEPLFAAFPMRPHQKSLIPGENLRNPTPKHQALRRTGGPDRVKVKIVYAVALLPGLYPETP